MGKMNLSGCLTCGRDGGDSFPDNEHMVNYRGKIRSFRL